jgi:hypothetical protein
MKPPASQLTTTKMPEPQWAPPDYICSSSSLVPRPAASSALPQDEMSVFRIRMRSESGKALQAACASPAPATQPLPESSAAGQEGCRAWRILHAALDESLLVPSLPQNGDDHISQGAAYKRCRPVSQPQLPTPAAASFTCYFPSSKCGLLPFFTRTHLERGRSRSSAAGGDRCCHRLSASCGGLAWLLQLPLVPCHARQATPPVEASEGWCCVTL